MVNLNGHEAGNGGYSQRTPTARRDSSTRSARCSGHRRGVAEWLAYLNCRARCICAATVPIHCHCLEQELDSYPVMQKSPRKEIEYCTRCRWLLRAAWMAQELLNHLPGRDRRARPHTRHGRGFEVRVDHEVIWSRADKGRFPEIKELKQLVRDRIAPDMDLGHTDR